jgi:hypothetical protein
MKNYAGSEKQLHTMMRKDIHFRSENSYKSITLILVVEQHNSVLKRLSSHNLLGKRFSLPT